MIIINIDKAKDIAHDHRRATRTEKFAPLDIKATIPSQAVEAEIARQNIRDKDAKLQIEIDQASDLAELKSLML